MAMVTLLSAALLGAALASEAPAPEPLLEAAARLEATGEEHAARDALRQVLYTSPEYRQVARERLQALPATGWDVWGPRARMMLVQGIMWSTALGPATSFYMDDAEWRVQERTGFSLAVLGGAAGIGAGWWYGRTWFPTHAQAGVINGVQILAGAHGAMLGMYTRADWDEDVWRGWQLGTLAGIGAGYALGRVHWDRDAVAWARMGALWGMGLGFAVQTMRYAWNDGEAQEVLPVVFLAADLGVAGGYALGRYTGLTRQDAYMGMIGTTTFLVLMWVAGATTVGDILWTESSAAAALTASGVLGAGAGIALGRGVDSLLPERPPWKRDGVALIAPGVAPRRDGGVQLSLVQGVF